MSRNMRSASSDPVREFVSIPAASSLSLLSAA
jgi:hypothetical protein